MSYSCEVLADSVSPEGARLVTMCCTYPRFIHSELMTHRVFSRNAASSRAIPPEKLIARVMEDPFVPETFNKRVKGMGVGEVITDQDLARGTWLRARDEAVRAAEDLVIVGIDKSRINRLLEPFMWMTTIISATEWSNFFALRCHLDAQPEFRITAEMMRDAMGESQPLTVGQGEWHLPLVGRTEMSDYALADDIHLGEQYGAIPFGLFWAMVSAGRCARVSFDTQDQYEDPDKSYERAERLKTSGHLSPFEHCARPVDDYGVAGDPDYGQWEAMWTEFVGNFRGWVQMRKMITDEHDFFQVVKA